jgi:hypothetical protein
MGQKSTFSKKTSYFGTLALSSLFHLLKLEQACTSLYKLKKVLCMFTDGHVRHYKQNTSYSIVKTITSTVQLRDKPIIFVIRKR